METDPGGSGNGASTMAMEMESKEQTIEELRAELEMVRQELSKKDDDKKTNERLMMIIEAQQRTITDLTVKLDLLLKTQVPSHLNITNSSDAGIRIIPKSEDDYRRIIRLFREEEVPHHTFPLPSERNIHAVIRGVHATLSEIEIKEELQHRGYSPLHIIRLKRGGGVPMPLVVVILPKIEKSQQLFNEHELLGLAIRVEVQKNSILIGQCHRCQKYGMRNLTALHHLNV